MLESDPDPVLDCGLTRLTSSTDEIQEITKSTQEDELPRVDIASTRVTSPDMTGMGMTRAETNSTIVTSRQVAKIPPIVTSDKAANQIVTSTGL